LFARGRFAGGLLSKATARSAHDSLVIKLRREGAITVALVLKPGRRGPRLGLGRDRQKWAQPLPGFVARTRCSLLFWLGPLWARLGPLWA